MYVISYGMIFMCILLYVIMCMFLPVTSTHLKWELILYWLHCPALNKIFLVLLFTLTLCCNRVLWKVDSDDIMT